MLDNLRVKHGSRPSRRRVGRGIGSGKGKTAGRGYKGAGSRSGFKRRTWFEGGQMPLARRVPKRGFTNIFRRESQVVNLKDLARFTADQIVDAAALAEAGLISHPLRAVKLLAEGEIAIGLSVRVNAISASARQKLEAAGGSVEIVPARKGASRTSAPAIPADPVPAEPTESPTS